MPRSKRPTIAVRSLLLAAALAIVSALAWPPGRAMAATDSVTVVNPGAQTTSEGLTWYWIVKAKTNSSGHFSATVKDEFGSATWPAQFNGNGSHLATAPAGVYVRVS